MSDNIDNKTDEAVGEEKKITYDCLVQNTGETGDDLTENTENNLENEDDTVAVEQCIVKNTYESTSVSEVQQTKNIEQGVEINIKASTKLGAASTSIERPKPLTNDEVTGYTANLWKYIPIPVNEPEPAPEYINDMFSFRGSKVIAARVRGKKHKHEGTNCDDWYEVASHEQITFVAVSDGAGSKKFSRIGARKSCKSAIGYLVNSFKKAFEENPKLYENLELELSNPKCMEACGMLANIVQKSVIKAYEAVEAAYYSRSLNTEYSNVLNRNLQLNDFSATLLLAVIIPVSATTKENLIISCQIGDGMIAVLNSKGEFENSLKLMGVPDSGDFSGETDFLTSLHMKNIEALQTRTKISRSIIDTVFIMTDGVADDYFPNETEIRRLYYDLLINGIIEKSDSVVDNTSLTPQQMSIFKKIPDPLVYPWVNNQNVKNAVQYTKRICEAAQISLKDMWTDSTVLDLAKLEMDKINNKVNPDEQLRIWLDNYVERGSFDDRTLVVVRL